MMEPDLARAHVFVSGSVQGVFFRQEAARRAGSRDVVGWIRNLPDGRVEAVFEGYEAAVQSLVEWCERGPQMADVRDVSVSWEEPKHEEENFSVR